MAADDLAGLFAPPPPGPAMDLRYRQGVIQSFDPVTLSNTVDVGGTLLTDLALLGVGEARLLTPGAVVGIVSVTSTKGTGTWAIIGRLVIPNTPEAANATTLLNSQVTSASVLTEEVRPSDINYGDLATAGPEVDVNVGASGRLLVLITTQINWLDTNPSTTAGGLASIELSGSNVLDPFFAEASLVAVTIVGFASATALTMVNASTATATFEGLNPGPTKVTMKYRCANFEDCSFARRTLVVIAL